MLDVKNLSVRRARREILTELSFSLPRGSMTALVGRNGSGKSTLLSALGGTCPASGEMLLDGIPLPSLSPRAHARHITFLPQRLAAPHMTVHELVSLGRHPHRTSLLSTRDADRDAILRAIEDADVASLANRYLDELSGGERQRAYLAMILAQDAPLWLLDEPTTYMDLPVAARFMALLSSLRQKRQKTLLVAMHDLGAAVRYADRIAILDEGHLTFFGTVEDCLACDAIERTFSVRRIDASGETFFTN